MSTLAPIDRFATVEFQTARPELSSLPVQQAQVKFYRRLDDAIDLALTQTEVACRAGCDHCCHYVIRATGAEMLLIKQHLVNTASPTTLKTVMDRARANVQAGKGLDIEQLTATNLPCPFLQSGQCSIYEVRPANCRGYHSTDVAQCKASFERPQEILPRKVARPVEDAAGGLVGGYLQAQQSLGLDAREYELNSALLEAMTSAQLAQRLKAGKRALLKARVVAGAP
jgi:Fe-S-cluster containining protein